MRNVVLVTKIEGVLRKKHFVVIDKIMAVEVATSKECRIYFDNAVWIIPSEEYERVMHVWAPYYKELKEYKDYIENK